MPMVLEANAISEELNKKMFFEIALVSPQARGLKDGRTEVSIIWLKNLIRNLIFCSLVTDLCQNPSIDCIHP